MKFVGLTKATTSLNDNPQIAIHSNQPINRLYNHTGEKLKKLNSGYCRLLFPGSGISNQGETLLDEQIRYVQNPRSPWFLGIIWLIGGINQGKCKRMVSKGVIPPLRRACMGSCFRGYPRKAGNFSLNAVKRSWISPSASLSEYYWTPRARMSSARHLV